MTIGSRFTDKFSDSIAFALSCFDRVIFQGHLLPFCHVGGLESLVDSRLKLRRKDFMAWAKGQSQRIVAHAQAMAQASNRPYLYLDRYLRKEELAQKILGQQPVDEGLVCILRCLEHSASFRLVGGQNRPGFARARPLSLVFYFYFRDRDLGLIHVRLPTLFPFSIQVAVNGHNFLACQLRKNGIAFVQEDNLLTQVGDVPQAQKLADRFERQNWPQRLRALARRVLPLMDDVLQEYTHYWVVDQAEYASDLVFSNPSDLQRLYPHLLDYAALHFAAKDLLTFLGRRLHPLFDGQVQSLCRKDRWPGARVRHHVGDNAMKMYDKLSRALRIETVINDPRQFQVRRQRRRQGQKVTLWCPMNKGVVNLYRYRQVALAANARYLDALSVVDPTHQAQVPLHRLAEPCRARGRSYAGFNPARPQDLALFRALLDGDHLLRGLRNGDVRTRLFAPPGNPDPLQERRRSTAVSRLLKRLHVRGFLVKVPHSRRWHLTLPGRQILSATIEAYHRHLPQAFFAKAG